MEGILDLALCTISGMSLMSPTLSKPSRYHGALVSMSIAGNILTYIEFYFRILKTWRIPNSWSSFRLYFLITNTLRVCNFCVILEWLHVSFWQSPNTYRVSYIVVSDTLQSLNNILIFLSEKHISETTLTNLCIHLWKT